MKKIFAVTLSVSFALTMPLTVFALNGNCYTYYLSDGTTQTVCPGLPTTQSAGGSLGNVNLSGSSDFGSGTGFTYPIGSANNNGSANLNGTVDETVNVNGQAYSDGSGVSSNLYPTDSGDINVDNVNASNLSGLPSSLLDSSGSSGSATMGCSSSGLGGSLGSIGSQLLGGLLNSVLGQTTSALGGSSGYSSSPYTGVPSDTGSAQAAQILANAAAQAAPALVDVAGALRNALHQDIDLLFQNPKSATPKLLVGISDTTLTQTVEGERIALEQTVQEDYVLATTPVSESTFSQMSSDIGSLQTFMTQLTQAVGDALTERTAGASEIQNYQAALDAAGKEISDAAAEFAATRSAYESAAEQAQAASSAASSAYSSYGSAYGSTGLLGTLGGLGTLGLGTGSGVQIVGTGLTSDGAGNIYNAQGGLIGQGTLTSGGALITGGSTGLLGGLSSVLQGGAINGLVNGQNLGSIVSLLSGGSQSGQLIGMLLSSNLGSQAVSGLLGSLGISGSSLSSLFGGSGAAGQLTTALGGGSLNGLLAGAGLGSALGLVGGALGGNTVPVSEQVLEQTNAKIQQNAQQIQSDQDTQLQVTCVNNVLVRQTANQFAAQQAQTVIQETNTGNGGGPQFPQNISQEEGQLRNTVFQNTVNNLQSYGVSPDILSQVQQSLVTQRQAGATQLTCDIPNGYACYQDINQCGTTDQEKLANRAAVMSIESQCVPIWETAKVSDIEKQLEESRISDREKLLQYADGLIPKQVCNDPGASQNTPDYLCQNYVVQTPPSVQTAITNQAYQLGAQKEAAASEIGQLVNSLFAQIASQVLTSLTGSIGLSQSSLDGSGSYLDQSLYGTGADTLSQAQGALRGDIENALGIEGQYESLLEALITNIDNARSSEKDVFSCYLALATSTSLKIDSKTALARANDASTTVTQILDPEVHTNNKQLSLSDNLISQLNLLDNEVQVAQSIDQVNAVAQAFEALVTSGATHTTTDLNLLQATIATNQATLSGILQETGDSLAVCQGGGK